MKEKREISERGGELVYYISVLHLGTCKGVNYFHKNMFTYNLKSGYVNNLKTSLLECSSSL